MNTQPRSTPYPGALPLPGASHPQALAAKLGAAARQLRLRISNLAHRPGGPARALRDFATSVRERDPRFAADLYAAADRHEALSAL
jgi:hypothetical protein